MSHIKEIVIVADGEFPTHPIPLKILNRADYIISCDGATEKLLSYGITPNVVTGDMDSINPNIIEEYGLNIVKDECQETNDLTKAIKLATKISGEKISILAATGLREDHTLGNISLLSDYSKMTTLPVTMWTNYGRLFSIERGGVFETTKGSQVSIFALDCNIKMESKGLKYSLKDVVFDNWWKASLNEATGENFELIFEKGRVILFISYT